jgi:hypothetical protein
MIFLLRPDATNLWFISRTSSLSRLITFQFVVRVNG